MSEVKTGTIFVTAVDEYDGQEWPDSTSHRETVVQGDLADKVRARTGLSGEVRIVEDGTEGGYSEYTVEWEYDFEVRVGQDRVFSTESPSPFDHADKWSHGYSGFGQFMRWLEGPQ